MEPLPFGAVTRSCECSSVTLTGRNAHPLLLELADTVTEMREVKHGYQKGTSLSAASIVPAARPRNIITLAPSV